MTQPMLSLVIPVYNAMPYLTELLESVYSQDMSESDYEVIAVDDGSTDSSGAELDRFAAAHPNMTVIHQENWGWPDQPRNRGLALATGRYVFFGDSDDVFDPKAFAAVTAFAEEHGSDVVLPQLGSLDGRWVQSHVFKTTQIDADIELAMKSLGPTKLFRRSFLEEHGLRFPEDKMRLEDAVLVARAYHAASRVSILSGKDYYVVRLRNDGENISQRASDPDGYTAAIARVCSIVRECDPDHARAQRVILDLYRRKILKFYQPARYLRTRVARAEKLLVAHRRFQDEYISVELENRLGEPFRSRSRLIRTTSVANMRTVAQVAADNLDPIAVSWQFGIRGATVRVEDTSTQAHDAEGRVELEVGQRGGRQTTSVPVQMSSDTETSGVEYVFRLGLAVLLRRGTGILDFHLTRYVDFGGDIGTVVVSRERLAGPGIAGTLVDRVVGIVPYRTVQDNFSVRLPKYSALGVVKVIRDSKAKVGRKRD